MLRPNVGAGKYRLQTFGAFYPTLSSTALSNSLGTMFSLLANSSRLAFSNNVKCAASATTSLMRMVQTRTNSTASSGLPGTSRSAVDSISQPLTPNTSEPHSTWNFLRTQPISKTSKTQSSQEMWKATETSHIHSRPPGPYAGLFCFWRFECNSKILYQVEVWPYLVVNHLVALMSSFSKYCAGT